MHAPARTLLALATSLWLAACADIAKAPQPPLAAVAMRDGARVSPADAARAAPPSRPASAPWVPSAAARRVVQWALQSGDHGGEPFMVVDKRNAQLLVYDGRGRLMGRSPVLLGLARGDHTVPGIADKPLEQIRADERTTPAGRFVAERGRNLKGDDILWVDYDAAVSMHRVRSVNPGERRLERLRTPTARDNRISYGCINVPVAFFDRVVERAVGARKTIVVYVLPDTKPLEAVFDVSRAAVG